MFVFKPDYEQAKQRIDAWWNGEILDRPLTYITFPKPENERVPVPQSQHPTHRDRYMDVDFQADRALAQIANNVYYGDAMPVAMPNLGPDVFAAFYGCPLEFGAHTSWSKPILHDWSPENVDRIRLDTDNLYYKKILELTDAYIERGKGKFIVGVTDLHAGGDAIAAFRDPQNLCLDMLTNPDEVKALVDRVTDDLFKLYDVYRERTRTAGMPCSSWIHLVSDGLFHIPSNDFSCMISDAQFEDIFLPGIARECAHMTHNIYHLDGPKALRFLDRLLEVPNLQAIQWVPGAGNEGWRRWLHVYKRIQQARRGFMVWVNAAELDEFMDAIGPQGAFLTVSGVKNQEEADAVLKKVARWGRR